MKYLLLIVVVLAVIWFFRVQIMAKVLGQDEARVRRMLGRRKGER
ncbi:hypothetical protein CLV56_1225 [Mumia flava]|uniref:Uncharacterized protein n=1 Tax=Mumia flava TaxID=1348852 RepID=A0A2M9BGC2_9ACTN|nr:hypothetical protein [Mumia flava]PJJ57006.1 hypothetical protein CLV56_1225 [Mumia flava]